MPLHPTAAQTEASRRNGRRSSGPITEAGKATAARNSLRHGLAAGTFTLLAHEDPVRWEALRTALIGEYEPATPAEAALIERLARSFWRFNRVDAVETLVFAALLSPDTHEPEPHRPPLPSLATLARYRARIDRERRDALAELAQLQAERRVPASRMHEPEARRHVAVPRDEAMPPRTDEPDGPPARPLNRAARRRFAALARHLPPSHLDLPPDGLPSRQAPGHPMESAALRGGC
jgi:hypothetical protein